MWMQSSDDLKLLEVARPPISVQPLMVPKTDWIRLHLNNRRADRSQTTLEETANSVLRNWPESFREHVKGYPAC
jgi:hypothetical protein